MSHCQLNICCFCAAGLEKIIVHTKDGIILNVNHAFVTMTGYEVAELIAKNGFQLAIPESQKLIIKNFISKYEKPDEIVVVKKNGSTLTVELLGKVIPRSNKCEC